MSDVAEDDPNAPRGDPPTIFVADDDDGFRRIVVHELVKLGYRVIEAADGGSAAKFLAGCADGLTRMPDLVLLDVCMPEFSGLGVLGLMGRFDHAPPALVITGFDDDSVDVVAGRRGARRVFHKPIELDDLLAAVDDALSRRR
jgi:DNA-binding response OmpR family regulator